MSIKETVKQALTHIRGNQVTPLFVIQVHADDYTEDENRYTGEQVRRALRDIPYVKRINNRYVVKGRRVPPMPVAASQLVDNAPKLTKKALDNLRKAA